MIIEYHCRDCGVEILRRFGVCLDCERRHSEFDLERLVMSLAKLPGERRNAIVRGLCLSLGVPSWT